MIEDGDVYYIEMELMAGVVLGSDDMDVDGGDGDVTLGVSTSTKAATRPPAMREKEKTCFDGPSVGPFRDHQKVCFEKGEKEKRMSQGDALLTSLQDWKKERTIVQQNTMRHFIRQ